MEQLLTYAVLGLVGIRLVSAAKFSLGGDGRRTAREIVRLIRWKHVWPIPFVLTTVGLTASAFLAIPGLDWGWWTALGGQGNPITGTTDRTTGTVWEWIIPLVFLALLLPALPLFALAEERIFRRGAEGWTWPKRLVKLVSFGMVHAIVGIPIGVALALSFGGAYFMNVYLRRYRETGDERASMFESAAAHTAYNGFVLSIVLVVVVASAFGVG